MVAMSFIAIITNSWAWLP